MLLRCQMQYNMLMPCPHYAGVDSVNGSQSLFSWPLVTEIMACAAVRGTTSGFHCYHGPRVVMWVQMTPLTRWAPLGHVRISEKSTRKQPTLPPLKTYQWDTERQTGSENIVCRCCCNFAFWYLTVKQLLNYFCILVESMVKKIVESLAPANILETKLATCLEIFFSNVTTLTLRQNDGSWGDSGGRKNKSIIRGGNWVRITELWAPCLVTVL